MTAKARSKAKADNGMKAAAKPKLIVRQARIGDVEEIENISRRAFAPQLYNTAAAARSQISNFPEGQFVAEYEGKIVGHCATFRISGDIGLKPHTWSEITGGGLASRHDPEGDWLYGMEVCVDPDYRRLRIGQRLYDARRQLCRNLKLKGITFGGRMPGYAKRSKSVGSPQVYLEKVTSKAFRDSVILFHLSNGFEPIGILEGYDPYDYDSRGFAVHMVWRNPLHAEETSSASASQSLSTHDTIRVATVQWQMRAIGSKEEFSDQIEYFIDVASDYRADFVVLPELFTLQLLSLDKKSHSASEAIARVSGYTEWYIEFMSQLAVSYNINIIAGSHPNETASGEIRNTAYIFLRDGSIHTQDKIHPTPSEAYWWNIKGGDKVDAINTDCGLIGVLICYDAEFPELARRLADQGAMILFVPFCTDERRSYMRVRYCSHARAIENQFYVVMSGVVGNLPKVENMDIHYAESCILTPCDFTFSRDGVAADTAPNTETIAFADLRLSDLRVARSSGSVRNLKDRRFDLYHVAWSKQHSR
ncbi:MAG TPA: GNAT family N-acetyltransferase [Hyphomicrobiales bacterium]|nr:GNAT family N-acetyltransferase [Hyphomicrobiales bacterium]